MSPRAALLVIPVSLLAMATPTAAAAQAWERLRPDAYAPLGVPADRVLESRRFLVGVSSDFVRFGHLRDGTATMTTADAFALGYTEAPSALGAHEHVLSLLYGAAPGVTGFVELPYLARTMDVDRQNEASQSPSVRGLGDARAGMTVRVVERGAMVGQADLTAHLPTGAADREEADGSMIYAMQLGAGTLGLSPGLTVMGQRPRWSWGGRLAGTVWPGESARRHAPGNRVEATAWGSRRLTTWMNGAVRVAGEAWGDVRDDATTQPANPAVEPALTGGRRVTLLASANLFSAAGLFQGHRLYGEIGVPVWQDLDGPQRGVGWRGVVGWSWRVP